MLEDRTLLSAAPAVSYLQTPLNFQANVGQADPSAQFISQGNGYSLALTATEATLAVLPVSAAAPPTPGQTSPPPPTTPTLMHMQLVGGNASAQGTALDEQTAKTNYEIGSDPSQWRMNVANYGEVQYQGVYQGINVVYHGSNQQQLEYDFTVAPAPTRAGSSCSSRASKACPWTRKGTWCCTRRPATWLSRRRWPTR